jgi:amino acid transporter
VATRRLLGEISRVGQLRHGVVGLGQTFAQSFALLALALGSATGTSVVASFAGASVPLVYVLGGIVSLCLGSVIIRFTRRMASSGSLYTYISRGINPSAGFIGGWLYSLGFAAGISFVMVISSVYLSQVFTAHAHIHIGWFPLFFVEMALLTLLALVDIRISTRAQLIAAAIGALAILVGMIITLAKGGADGITAQPLNPSHVSSVGNLFHGLVFAFGGYIGFEAAASLGEEAKNPLKVIPRAVLCAVLVGIVFYVFVTFAMSVGFGVDGAGKWAQDPTAYDTLVTHYAGKGLAVIVDLAVVLDAFVASLAATVLVSRTVFAMGRDGGLPRAFAWTHPRWRTPWVGILASIALTLVLVIWLGYLTYDPLTYFGFMATTATFWLLGTYILMAAAGIVYFWRQRREAGVTYNPLLDFIAPAVAIGISVLTIYWSIHPVPPHPLDEAPWIALGWLCLGIVIVLWMRAKAPSRVAGFGRTLGEEASHTGREPEEPPAAVAPSEPVVQ